MTDQFKKFDLKMREGDIPQVIRKVFKDYYKRLLKGDRGLINEENNENLRQTSLRCTNVNLRILKTREYSHIFVCMYACVWAASPGNYAGVTQVARAQSKG